MVRSWSRCAALGAIGTLVAVASCGGGGNTYWPALGGSAGQNAGGSAAGVGGAPGTSGGATAKAGRDASGGATGEGGTSTAGNGGTVGENGGDSGIAGAAGGESGSSGSGGASGGNAGSANAGGASGSAGSGGAAGMSGSAGKGGSGGTGGSTAAPCDGICDSPIEISIQPTYNSGNLGTGATCYELADGAALAGGCQSFESPRTLRINDVLSLGCSPTMSFGLPPARNGGYCFEVSAGLESYASFYVY